MEFLLQNIGKIILSILGAVLLIVIFKNYAKIKTFLLEVKAELTKVSWSTRQELIGSTIVVIIVTSIMAVYIGVIDLALSRILSIMFK